MDVMLDAQSMSCRHCGETYNPKVAGWIVELENGNPTGYQCPPCSEKHGVKPGSFRLDAIGEASFLFDAPVKGNFKPVKTLKEIEEFRSAGALGFSWWELEDQIVEFFTYPYPTLKMTINNRSFKELGVSFRWENDQVVELQFSGDRPSKGQEFTIHQKYRLKAMGLTESAEKNSNWSISLSATEREPINVARVVSHILQFGLFVEPHKNGGIGTTVDTDQLRPGFKDPNEEGDASEVPLVKPEAPPLAAPTESPKPLEVFDPNFKLQTAIEGPYETWGVVDDLIRDLVVANKPKTAELRFVIKDQGVVVFEVARSGGDWLMTIDHDHWVGPKLGAEYSKAMISESWKAPNADQGLFHGRAEQAKLAALICNQLSKVQKLTPQDVVNVMVTVSGRNYSDS